MSGTPMIKTANGELKSLTRLPLSLSSAGLTYDETLLDSLLFENPQLLPIADIDRAYLNPVPICMELNTEAGPLDILYATKDGRLVIVENKLWRNPAARREVIGQILDYASALSQWSYADLQRQISARTKRKGNVLFKIVHAKHPEIIEHEFVDEVSRSLQYGRFLLLICGDGIRERTASIAEFLDRHTTLDFSFGLVQIGLYAAPDDALLVLPSVIAKTDNIRREVVLVPDGVELKNSDAPEETAKQPSKLQKRRLEFWTEFAKRVEFDDPEQRPPNPSTLSNVYLRMPWPQSWITLYFDKSAREIGTFLTFNRLPEADALYAALIEEKETIEREFGQDLIWKSDGSRHRIFYSTPFEDTHENGEKAMAWFLDASNRMVNIFRPRIADWLETL